jgi:hypothetical protein
VTNRTNVNDGVNVLTHRRTPRVPGAQAPGTWPNSFFACPLVTVTGAPPNLTPTHHPFVLASGLEVPVLLFTSDVPIFGGPRSLYTAIQVEDDVPTGPIDLPGFADFPEDFALISDEAIQAPALLTPAAGTSPVVEKQYSVGVTDTGAVRVTGFMGVIRITDRGIESPLTTAQNPTLSLTVHAEGAVIFGAGNLFDATGVAGDPTSSQSIIMDEAAYTQQMWDDGNLFVDVNGIVNHIMGLWGPQFTVQE